MKGGPAARRRSSRPAQPGSRERGPSAKSNNSRARTGRRQDRLHRVRNHAVPRNALRPGTAAPPTPPATIEARRDLRTASWAARAGASPYRIEGRACRQGSGVVALCVKLLSVVGEAATSAFIAPTTTVALKDRHLLATTAVGGGQRCRMPSRSVADPAPWRRAHAVGGHRREQPAPWKPGRRSRLDSAAEGWSGPKFHRGAVRGAGRASDYR